MTIVTKATPINYGYRRRIVLDELQRAKPNSSLPSLEVNCTSRVSPRFATDLFSALPEALNSFSPSIQFFLRSNNLRFFVFRNNADKIAAIENGTYPGEFNKREQRTLRDLITHLRTKVNEFKQLGIRNKENLLKAVMKYYRENMKTVTPLDDFSLFFRIGKFKDYLFNNKNINIGDLLMTHERKFVHAGGLVPDRFFIIAFEEIIRGHGPDILDDLFRHEISHAAGRASEDFNGGRFSTRSTFHARYTSDIQALRGNGILDKDDKLTLPDKENLPEYGIEFGIIPAYDPHEEAHAESMAFVHGGGMCGNNLETYLPRSIDYVKRVTIPEFDRYFERDGNEKS